MVSSTRIDIPQLPPVPSWTMPQTSAGGPSFQDMLSQALHQVAGYESKAQSLVTQSISGGDVTQAEATIALREADLALRMMQQVRNKILEAYNEIKGMQF